MDSTNSKSESTASLTSPAGKSSSSRTSKRNNKESRDSSSIKAKERSRRARDSPATTPGAVPSSSSNRPERKKESGSGGKRSSRASVDKSYSGGRKSRSSSSGASKPGAVPSTGRSSRKGNISSRSSSNNNNNNNKSSHRPSSKASLAGSSTMTRSSSRPINEEKQAYLARNAPPSDRGPSVAPSSSVNEMESGIVAEAVDDENNDSEMKAIATKALREVEALRQELQRTREEQEASHHQSQDDEVGESRRRKIPLWGKVCLGSLILIGGVIGVVVALGGGSSGDEATTLPSAAATIGPTGSSPVSFDPPSASECSKVSDGLPVDGQEDMVIKQRLTIKMIVYLTVDLPGDIWLPDMLQNIQQLVMPPVVGCGNYATLELLFVGNAQIDQSNLGLVLVPCEDKTNGPCYTVEFPVDLFMKQEVVSYDLDEIKQHVEGVFETSTSLVVNAQDENSKVIKDIGSVAISTPVTSLPSQQPSSKIIVTSGPSTSTSLVPTTPSTSRATESPTPGPTDTPASGPTLSPSLAPSLSPTMFPTAGPTVAPVPGETTRPTSLPSIQPTALPSPLPTPGPTSPPTPGPTAPPSPPPTPGPTIAPTPGPSDSPSRAPSPNPSQQPSAVPSTSNKCTRLEAILARFAPFDGNKTLALDWLCSVDTWEPPSSATDETSQSLWEERFVLAVFYYSTDGDDGSWTNNNGWLSAASVCSWTGINGCNGDDSVTKIGLSSGWGNSYGLAGDFPDEMRALTNLEHVNFEFNRYLSGRIPSFLPELTKLTYLGIGDTGRTGSIPSELLAMTQLQELRLWGNFLTGTMPSGIGAMTELIVFFASFNDLTGSLPVDAFDSMTRLTNLSFNENYLTGSMPPLPSSLTRCFFAMEHLNGAAFETRSREGNCFTDTTNVPYFCNLSSNCPP